MDDQNLEPLLTVEPFVSADKAAAFLGISRRHLLAMARRGMRGAYSLGTGTKRKMRVFRLSELAEGVISGNIQPAPSRGTMSSGSPRSQKGRL